ncbi:hypothetical protein FCJ61_27730 [Burkholderia metallica]|uniref:hypothetical protein n=1 Tax=Burkholderia metallica TaxID=488729 RepID=UPI00157B0FB3|nr:hypothetical protein [Burkholderia metallica]NTZ86686.1 hypothetical protein [Burkholderia metallica]
MIVMAAGVAALMSPSAYGGSGALSQGTGGSGAGARIVVDPAPQPDLPPASDPFLFPTVRLQQAIDIGPESKTR